MSQEVFADNHQKLGVSLGVPVIQNPLYFSRLTNRLEIDEHVARLPLREGGRVTFGTRITGE